jgi:hypothetical protein
MPLDIPALLLAAAHAAENATRTALAAERAPTEAEIDAVLQRLPEAAAAGRWRDPQAPWFTLIDASENLSPALIVAVGHRLTAAGIENGVVLDGYRVPARPQALRVYYLELLRLAADQRRKDWIRDADRLWTERAGSTASLLVHDASASFLAFVDGLPKSWQAPNGWIDLPPGEVVSQAAEALAIQPWTLDQLQALWMDRAGTSAEVQQTGGRYVDAYYQAVPCLRFMANGRDWYVDAADAKAMTADVLLANAAEGCGLAVVTPGPIHFAPTAGVIACPTTETSPRFEANADRVTCDACLAILTAPPPPAPAQAKKGQRPQRSNGQAS